MKHRRHFDPNLSASRDMARISGPISDIDRVIRILDADIAVEEARIGSFDHHNPACSIPARISAARRDNLRETIAVLEKQIADINVARSGPSGYATSWGRSPSAQEDRP